MKARQEVAASAGLRRRCSWLCEIGCIAGAGSFGRPDGGCGGDFQAELSPIRNLREVGGEVCWSAVAVLFRQSSEYHRHFPESGKKRE